MSTNTMFLFLRTSLLVGTLAGCCSRFALADGFHNSTKKFTDPQQMTAQDWSDPDELERTWNAALVRIPNGAAGIVKFPMHKLNVAKFPKRKK